MMIQATRSNPKGLSQGSNGTLQQSDNPATHAPADSPPIDDPREAVEVRIEELEELCWAQVNAWAAERRLNELIREVGDGNLGLPALWQVTDPINSITLANDYSYL
jgi:hypothetical protein